MNIDEFIEHTQETARKHRYHADFFDINNPMRVACIKSAEDCEQLAEWLEKSKGYQQLEEQGKLIKLPCKVGDTVYHVAQGKIVEVSNVDLFFLLLSVAENRFNNSVLLTKAEAETKLKELRGGENE